jgi:hypothetical protein
MQFVFLYIGMGDGKTKHDNRQRLLRFMVQKMTKVSLSLDP